VKRRQFAASNVTLQSIPTRVTSSERNQLRLWASANDKLSQKPQIADAADPLFGPIRFMQVCAKPHVHQMWYVLETLRALASKGIDRVTVEASLNAVEFRLRENNFGSFPRGVAAMLHAS
jgi:hypothetical protein